MSCWSCDNPKVAWTGKGAIGAPGAVGTLDLCQACFDISVKTQTNGQYFIVYCPQPHQQADHASSAPNLLALGPRGTGKSKWIRWEAILRCMTFPGFKALIIRRTIPDLRKSHLLFIGPEMTWLGDDVGYYRQTTFDVVFKNGSFIQFSHCETLKDVSNYLSSEWDLICFDELSTFPLEMFLNISAAARSPQKAPYNALVRAGSNTLGIGSVWMKQWFIDKTVNLAEYPDYHPADFEMHFSTMEMNKYINQADYRKRLSVLPDHVRRSWLKGEFVVEGAYFTDFMAKKIVDEDTDHEREVEWHVISAVPTYKGEPLLSFGGHWNEQDFGWVSIYRAVDWGYYPDPAVCLWLAMLPNRRVIAFKERSWKRTLAKDVANDIKRMSKGMKVVDTFCDPTMFIKTGNSPYAISDIFEQNGVPMSPAQNDRELFGYAIHELLNTMIDELPQLQIVEDGCPDLVRTLPILETDPNDARKIANGPDHWACCLAYFGMGQAMPAKDPVSTAPKRWMQPKRSPRNIAARNW